jgi:hypothetical protein
MIPNSSVIEHGVIGLRRFGTKPIDLSRSDLSSNTYFKGEVFVSHKVDGERWMMLVIDKNVYLISGQIINWISKTEKAGVRMFLDGEIYENRYYPFDVYFSETGITMNSEYKNKLKFVRSINGTTFGNYELRAKPTYSLKDDFFKTMEVILAERNYLDFKNDGLIFTPNKPEIPYVVGKQMKDTRKWKPYEKLTIDFELYEEKNIYKLMIEVPGKGIVPFAPEGKEFYIPKVVAENYENGQIVETYYDKDIRSFRIIQARAKATPNPIKQAQQIWKLISKPVTEQMLLGSDIEALRNYHRENKRTLIKDSLAQIAPVEERYVNPHTRNGFDYLPQEDYVIAKPTDRCPSFTYFPTNYTNRNRNNLLMALEHIYSNVDVQKRDSFCLIGFDDFLGEIPIEISDISTFDIRIIKQKKDLSIKNGVHLISFPRTQEERKLQFDAMKELQIETYLIRMGLDNVKTKYFINYAADTVIYPICSEEDLYIRTNAEGGKVETELFETNDYKERLNFFKKYIRRQKFDEAEHEYYDNCYSCMRERKIFQSYMKKPGFYRIIDDRVGETIHQNIAGIKNSAIDIGIGEADRWVGEKVKVLGLEPSFENYTGFLKRKGGREDTGTHIVNIGIQTKEDNQEIFSLIGDVKMGLVIAFDSLTFFYKNEEMLQNLINFIDKTVATQGVFSCIGLDAGKLLQLYEENKGKITKFYLKKLDDRKINISLGKDSIVSDQIEYIIHFDDFIMRMEKIGFKITKDYYLDNEKLLSFDEKLYSYSTRCIIFKRQNIEFPF